VTNAADDFGIGGNNNGTEAAFYFDVSGKALYFDGDPDDGDAQVDAGVRLNTATGKMEYRNDAGAWQIIDELAGGDVFDVDGANSQLFPKPAYQTYDFQLGNEDGTGYTDSTSEFYFDTSVAIADIRGNGANHGGLVLDQVNAGDYDPTVQFQLGGTAQYTAGVDDSSTDNDFVISHGDTLGANNVLEISQSEDTGGNPNAHNLIVPGGNSLMVGNSTEPTDNVTITGFNYDTNDVYIEDDLGVKSDVYVGGQLFITGEVTTGNIRLKNHEMIANDTDGVITFTENDTGGGAEADPTMYNTLYMNLAAASNLVKLYTVASPNTYTGVVNVFTINGGSTTVTTVSDAFINLKAGDTITANSVTRTVASKTDTNTVEVTVSVDWYNGGAGYPFTWTSSGEQDPGARLQIESAYNGADSLVLNSTIGGIDILAQGAAAGEDIDITATGSSINLTSTEAIADAIRIYASDAAGGADIDVGTGGFIVDQAGATGGISLDAAASSNYTVTG
ncbi:MAG: hypothetical protein CO109_14380, partial [Deltaproteobacteria bacterium CG_4_9_14_3_um_filter_65_9]